MPDHAAIDTYRRKLQETLSNFQFHALTIPQLTRANLSFPSIITYQGSNDLALKQQWSALFKPIFQAKHTPLPKRSQNTICVGFVVTHGHEGVFLKCMHGLINRLPDHRPFEITVVCSQQGSVEILSNGITHQSIRSPLLPSELEQAAEIVRDANFDILHYWECGTDTLNFPYV